MSGRYFEFLTNLLNHGQAPAVSPHPWQTSLGDGDICRSQLIRVPTGLGKTEGVLGGWLYHAVHCQRFDWPRRLVWCLPMRVLVEQTADRIQGLVDRWAESSRRTEKPTVQILMGGVDAGEWYLYPERPAILVGTQDMLLSRALNRGYASGRARWPMEFGLLNQDALWVMDEVQLMDVGLATSAQLQAFRDHAASRHLRPVYTWWMSATLQAEWLETPDSAKSYPGWIEEPTTVRAEQQTGRLWEIRKACSRESALPTDAKGFADLVLGRHGQSLAGAYGRITLVVCNTVERACATYEAIAKANPDQEVCLVHSRFRPAERESWRDEFLNRIACQAGVDRIIVATQVVEAGVDISATCLVTDLAPWPSLVQRFGRCARYGGEGTVVVVDRRKSDDDAAPYEPAELASAWNALASLEDVSVRALEQFEASLTDAQRQGLYPYAPAHLLLEKEFEELFDTTPDLTGADIDISRFIRSGDERDLQVFWHEIEGDGTPPADRQPNRAELCAVPFLAARDWLCGPETKSNKKPKLRSGMQAWVWDWVDGEWMVAERSALLPGRVVCVASKCGGYRSERGFDPDSREPVTAVSLKSGHATGEQHALSLADAQPEGEQLSEHQWKTIASHSAEVVDQAKGISGELRLSNEPGTALELAAWWHDWGKAHPAFQGSIRDSGEYLRPDRFDLAKAPKACWLRKFRYHIADGSGARPGFRHELASVLGLFALLRDYQPAHSALLGPWLEALDKLGFDVSGESNHGGEAGGGHIGNGQAGESDVHTATTDALPPSVARLLECSAEQIDLIAYLIVSHHGKVRVGLHAAPQDQEYRDDDGRGLPIRGIREGDTLPPVSLVPGEEPLPGVTLSLSLASLGLSRLTGVSWRERCLGLLKRFGPCSLGFLEALIRAADIRASRLETPDPTLLQEVTR